MSLYTVDKGQYSCTKCNESMELIPLTDMSPVGEMFKLIRCQKCGKTVLLNSKDVRIQTLLTPKQIKDIYQVIEDTQRRLGK